MAPGLHEHERKASRFSILFISLCFFAGIAFGYFVFLPISLQFFASFGTSLIKNNISVQAKSMIDMLRVIRTKTEGNLTAKEQGILDGILSDLELNYVEESSKK